MIDFNKAKKEFDIYLKDYDNNNSKVDLKFRHTLGVINVIEYISEELGLSQTDIDLAKLIALLHDIGRFEQAIKYDSFEDYQTMDHAQLADKILFENGLIRKFIDTTKYDNTISKAILNHNRLNIEEGLEEKKLLHAQLIRDADKLDNFRVRANDNFEDIFDSSLEGLEQSEITDKIYEDFMNSRMIISTERNHPADFWISYLAYIFDINFVPSFRYIVENEYIDTIIDRIDYKIPETKDRMENIRNHAKQFINKKLEDHE